MTSRQESKLNMYNALLAFCTNNTATIATLLAFPPVVTSFTNKRDQIDATAQLEAQVTTGITINKSDRKKSICQVGTNNAAAGYAYATSINDAVLKEKFNYSYSDLFRLKDDELTFTVQNIHDECNNIVANLAPYGVTAATLTAFQTEIDDYSAAVPSPRNATALRKTCREQLKTLFAEADDILKNQMDKLAQQFQFTEPEFYTTYKNNRIIIDAATSNSQAAGTITDAATSNPIGGVVITVDGQTFTTTSAADGTFSLKIPTPGTYTIIFTKTGYQTKQTTNVVITLGQTTPLDTQLTPA